MIKHKLDCALNDGDPCDCGATAIAPEPVTSKPLPEPAPEPPAEEVTASAPQLEPEDVDGGAAPAEDDGDAFETWRAGYARGDLIARLRTVLKPLLPPDAKYLAEMAEQIALSVEADFGVRG